MTEPLAHPAPEAQLAPLREEIRRAGRRSSETVGAWCSVIGLAALCLDILAGLPFWLVAPACLASAAAAAYGCLAYWRKRLRPRLLVLPPTDRAAVLQPLLVEGGHLGITRELLAEFTADLTHTELTPSAAPRARGDEATPAP